MSEITNYSTAAFLVNPNVRAIMCSYTPDKNDKSCTPRMFKTFDQDIAVGDYVVVPTDSRHKMTVCRVEEVDVQPDLDSPAKVDFVYGVVDTRDYDKAVSAENDMISTIKKNKEIERRKALAASLMSNQEELASLGFAKMGSPAPALPEK